MQRFTKKTLLLIFLISLGAVLLSAGAYYIYGNLRINQLLSDYDTYKEDENWDAARGVLLKMLRLSPYDSNLLKEKESLYQIYLSQGDYYIARYFYKEAIDSFHSALSLFKDDAVIERELTVRKDSLCPKLVVEEIELSVICSVNDDENSYTIESESIVEVNRGQPVRLFLYFPDEIIFLDFFLKTLDGKILASSSAFSLNVLMGINGIYTLIGVPRTLPGGIYELTGTGQTGDGMELFISIPLNIYQTEFPVEYIYLDKQLSNLFTTIKTDPKAQEQMEELYSVLRLTDPASIYETGTFIMPVTEAPVTSVFGHERVFIYLDGRRTYDSHSGIDYGAVAGTPVYATGTGKVVLVRDYVITGKTLILEHLPGVYSLYYHLLNIFVKEGQMVMWGEVVAEVGNTGLSTAAHLHFAINIAGISVDPNFFFQNKPFFLE